MLEIELEQLVATVQKRKAEAQVIELKAADHGCPTRLYDTLSSFSNQDSGGTIVFGVDEQRDYAVVGVYDAQDLLKHVTEQCNQMHPKVRAVFTMCDIDGRTVVSAEIPSIDLADRPCFYEGKGRNRGSYVRVGDADEPMTEYEIYSYEAFRRKYEDELVPVERADLDDLDSDELARYILTLKEGRPNLARLDDQRILDLMSIVRNGKPTLAAILLFCPYPQAFFPQLSIIATRIAGVSDGSAGLDGSRFADNTRIEGTLPQLIQGALAFVRRNMRSVTRISSESGERTDIPEYPIEAVRELIVNAVVHRDYSIHTQGMPIQLKIYDDRMEIINPGGLYGRLTVDQLGHVQPDTRNPVIANAMEVLRQTENRYSGIPTIRRLASESQSKEPLFENQRGFFRATLYPMCSQPKRKVVVVRGGGQTKTRRKHSKNDYRELILEFCKVPRSREEIADMLDIGTVSYAISRYVRPMVASGDLRLGNPQVPNSQSQTYVATNVS